MEGKTCKIDLLSGFIEFKSIIIKPYFIDDKNTENHSLTPVKISLIIENSLPNIIILFLVKKISITTTRPFWI